MKFFKTIPKLPKHKEPTFSHQHTCAYMYITCTLPILTSIPNPKSPAAPTHHTYLHVPAVKYKKLNTFTLYAHTCTYMYMCTCTYIHAHIMYMYMYMYIVHCTFFTFIPILNKHQNYHQNLKN